MSQFRADNGGDPLADDVRCGGCGAVTVTQVDRKADGTATYHFSVNVGQSETMEPGNGDALPADFFTNIQFLRVG
jgi:hypothetical protein